MKVLFFIINIEGYGEFFSGITPVYYGMTLGGGL